MVCVRLPPALNTELNVDDGNTFVGVLNGKYKVYIDPYYTLDPVSGHSNEGYMTVGYRGSNPYDAGVFYCPYVPLQMVRAVGENSFQPKIGFKTRYGMISNPFVGSSPSDGLHLWFKLLLQKNRNRKHSIRFLKVVDFF